MKDGGGASKDVLAIRHLPLPSAICHLPSAICHLPSAIPPVRVIRAPAAAARLAFMSTSLLSSYSDAIADLVAAIAPSVVQVRGRRRPLSGLVYDTDVVLTNARALGREDHLQVRTHDGRIVEAELAGWDPSSGLAVLRAAGLGVPAAAASRSTPRVGGIALAVARSWSNAVTASAGIIAVIGGPLRTGRRRSIEQVIRTTIPMHEGFAGGPLLDASGEVIGISTGAAIRGFEVAIPSAIAWSTAADVLKRGQPRRGFLGLAGQSVQLADSQRTTAGQEHALLVVGLTPDSPAAAAGFLVGDILLTFDGQAIRSAEDLLDLLVGDVVGKSLSASVLRGGAPLGLTVTVGEKNG
jgi:S1-C subfamily serine protease